MATFRNARRAARWGAFVFCAGTMAAFARDCPGQEPAAAEKPEVAGEPPETADVDYRDVFARMRKSSSTWIVWDDPGPIAREFLPTADDELLERMRADDDNGIAFTAAWEAIRRRVQEGEPTPRWVDAAALNRFVGFVEGRLRVPLPREWTEGVLSAWVTSQKMICFQSIEEKFDVETEAGWRVSGVDEANDFEDQLRITVGGHDLTVPASLRSDSFFSWQRFASVAHDSRRCYVAHFGPGPFSYTLYCLDLESGDRKWVTTVQVTLRHYGGGVPGVHRVWIVPRKKTVVVFGLCCGAYIEVFRKSDGRNLYRFCTDY